VRYTLKNGENKGEGGETLFIEPSGGVAFKIGLISKLRKKLYIDICINTILDVDDAAVVLL
jgi:hypothetical protein